MRTQIAYKPIKLLLQAIFVLAISREFSFLDFFYRQCQLNESKHSIYELFFDPQWFYCGSFLYISIMSTEFDKIVKNCSGPYGDLFIYQLQGRVKFNDEQTLGKYFLGNWVEDNTSFLFFSVPSEEIISDLLKKRPELELIDDNYLTYEQWQGGGITPITIENFVITPPWDRLGIDEGKINILLDPGLVFGTGLHPTTGDCLRAMACLNRDYPLERVLDLGTGTGILALAAARLGARKVLAVDLNPLCVKTAEKNVRLNNLESVIGVIEGKAENFADEHADLVVANIHYKVITRLLEKRAFPGKAWVVISGLMRSQAREIKERLEIYNLRLIHQWDDQMTWYTMLLKKVPKVI